MLFNSFEFLLFLPIVFLLYWALQDRLKLQNLFVVIVSYVFYGWWDWRFLILIAITTASSFLSGLLLEKCTENRFRQRIVSAGNIILNLLILCIFKYYNFFGENLYFLFNQLGMQLDWVTLDVILPVGISFYTFQSIGYTIDVYQKKLQPTRDVVAFFAFVSFFPQLVAGPIERATHLLPQFFAKRRFDYASSVDGMRQILWGFFKKMVIADNCAGMVDVTFGNYELLGGADLMLGALLFTFQIYCDFSGYSDIAVGTARLFGIDLMQNFRYPYFATSISDFWRRWHISLTTWFRDYIYIPLGGNRVSMLRVVRNTLIVFAVSGIWHGANWTFVVWGLYHAVLYIPHIFMKSHFRTTEAVVKFGWLTRIGVLLQMGVTFMLVMLGWIIFRAENINQAIGYVGRMFSHFSFSMPGQGKQLLLWVLLLVGVEWIQRNERHVLCLERFNLFKSPVLRYMLYYVLLIAIAGSSASHASFIYFRF